MQKFVTLGRNHSWKARLALIASLVTWLIVGCVVCGVQAAAADEFRVESKVFSGKDESVTSDSVTLFTDDRAYDFLSSPAEITVFDFQRNRIVLLDLNRKLRTELTTDKLNEFTEQLRVRASRQTDALLKFAANPKFDDSKSDADALEFSSPLMTYRVHPVTPDNANVVHAYRMFSDWSARLNALIHPGALPPFPRLAVNETLERNAEVPESVQLTVAPQNHLMGKPTVLRSEHQLSMRLLPADRKRIDDAGKNLVTFPEVSLEEYLRPVQTAKR
ncbi:MAG TPA: hypothetical protein VFE46_19680 [Pirellulales bacterium]|jgi:hypothetical protein|nr:hypothetical protein [Pirellulales bacterium]